MKRVTVLDGAAGNAVGWNPNGATIEFSIFDSAATNPNESYVSATVLLQVDYCLAVVQSVGSGRLSMACQTAPPEGAPLHYVITNLPAQVVQ
jgi:ABC-type branched-subunit amino acid transport system substrate-binding protein